MSVGRTAAPRHKPKGGRGGKSGLHGRTVPDNVRRGGPFGGSLRDSATEKRPPRARSVQPAARVKRCGKSAPRFRRRKRHGKPHREQDRIGTARAFGPRSVRTSRSGRLHDAPGNRRARGMAVTFAGLGLRAIQNPAYRPADTSNGGSAAKTAGPPPIFTGRTLTALRLKTGGADKNCDILQSTWRRGLAIRPIGAIIKTINPNVTSWGDQGGS